MTATNPIPTQPETLDQLRPWCRQLPQRHKVPANNPHDPCGGIVPRVRCITYQCPLNCFDMTPEDWNTRAAVTAPRGDRALYSELIHIAAELARGTDFLSTCAEDMNPRLKRADILKTAERQELQLKDWANRVRQAADQLSAATSSPTPAETGKVRSNHFSDTAIDKGFPDHISKDGAAYYNDGTVLRSAAPPERTRVEGEQWRQGMKDAAREVCDACDNEERYGPARKIEGSTRWWHGDDNIPCEAGGIWHVLAERTTNAAAPADNDAESVALVISTCGDCPFVDHSGAFTPGGAKATCSHRNAVETFAATVEGDDRHHWKYRQVDREAVPPAQCPLRNPKTAHLHEYHTIEGQSASECKCGAVYDWPTKGDR